MLVSFQYDIQVNDSNKIKIVTYENIHKNNKM